MIRVLFIYISLFSITFLQCSESKEKKDATKKVVISRKPKPLNKTQKGKSEYINARKLVSKGDYRSFNEALREFHSEFKNSIYLDSLILLEKQVKQLKQDYYNLRDSLFKISSEAYFNGLNLPTLDTINRDDYNLWNYSFEKEFTEPDIKIFNSEFEESWYLSHQPINEKTGWAVAYFNDCENYIYLYSIDSSFHILDSVLLYANGCYMSPVSDYKYSRYIINERGPVYNSIFTNDSSFTVIRENEYTLKDTALLFDRVEVGQRKSITYTLTENGHFLKIDSSGFSKPYADSISRMTDIFFQNS